MVSNPMIFDFNTFIHKERIVLDCLGFDIFQLFNTFKNLENMYSWIV